MHIYGWLAWLPDVIRESGPCGMLVSLSVSQLVRSVEQQQLVFLLTA